MYIISPKDVFVLRDNDFNSSLINPSKLAFKPPFLAFLFQGSPKKETDQSRGGVGWDLRMRSDIMSRLRVSECSNLRIGHFEQKSGRSSVVRTVAFLRSIFGSPISGDQQVNWPRTSGTGPVSRKKVEEPNVHSIQQNVPAQVHLAWCRRLSG